MNIFEGSRRVAVILAALIIIGSIIGIAVDKPNVVINYSVYRLGAEIIRSDAECRIGIDGVEWESFSDSKGRDFQLKFCFPASKAENGELLVPYKATGDYYLMQTPYNPEVREYITGVVSKHPPSVQDYHDADAKYTSALIRQWLVGLGYLSLGLFFYWLIIAAIGWIARGFMGIPRGLDKKA